MLRSAIIGLVLSLVIASAVTAQSIAPGQNTVQSFYQSIKGNWVGVCQQTTDGKPADNKYFKATISQVDANTFTGSFTYYRADKRTGAPVHIGDTTMTTTIDASGVAHSKLTGSGQVMISETESKNERHTLEETQTACGATGMAGQGNGKITVDGLPMNAGKNGKVNNAKSQWTLSNGTMTLDQSFGVKFKVLLFSKSFTIAAHSTAQRGTDLAALMGARGPVSQKTAPKTVKRAS